MATCYKAFHRRVVPSLDLESRRFGFDAEFTVKVARGGFRIFEVPVSYFARSPGRGQEDPAAGRILGPGRPGAAHPRAGEPALTRGALPLAAAAILAAVAFFLVRDHARHDSLSADEPIHILSGYFEVSGRTAIVNIEHPPLAKVLAGLALLRLPLPAPPNRVPPGAAFTDFGHAFLFANRVPADAIAAAARTPFRFLLAALLALVFLWARPRYGADARSLRGGARRVRAELRRARGGRPHRPGRCARVPRVGPGLGPRAPAALAGTPGPRRVRPRAGARDEVLRALSPCRSSSCRGSSPPGARPSRDGSRSERVARFAAVLAGAFAVVFAVYAAVTTRMNREEQRQVLWEMVGERGAPELARAIQAWRRSRRRSGTTWGASRTWRARTPRAAAINFLNGKTSVEGFPFYFFVAFLAKSSLAFLAAAALALLGAALFRAGREAALYLVPVAVLFLASIGSSYNIGIRHMLPVYPFLALAACAALARMSARGGRCTVLAAGLAVRAAALGRGRDRCASIRTSSPTSTPSSAGRRGGAGSCPTRTWTGASTCGGSRRSSRRRGVSDPTVVYFGGDDVLERVGVPDFSAEPRRRGSLVAVSAFHLAVGPAFYAYHGATEVAEALRGLLAEIAARGRPAGRVGYSMYLFEIPSRGSPPP